MVIGIDASRAFLKRRTGIEEYAYQTIKHLRGVIARTDIVILYVRKKLVWKQGKLQMIVPTIDFPLPDYWRVRGIWAPRFWTQLALSFEMLFRPPDVLFVPAHTLPLIHPARTVVTIHGLEYEFCPQAYSMWEQLYMRASIRFSCRAAKIVICVSENTRRDVMRLYGTPAEKIRVVYEGYAPIPAPQNPLTTQHPGPIRAVIENSNLGRPYLLFIGRLEERKNILRILEAFEVLKKQYAAPHFLLLAGKPGHGYRPIKRRIQETQRDTNTVRELGYVTEAEKGELLRHADLFLFPTLYEGFGIPILEAQAAGVPVVTSAVSSLPEVAGTGAVYVEPRSVSSIVSGIHSVLSDPRLRDDIITQGRANVRRFSWQRCAEAIGTILTP